VAATAEIRPDRRALAAELARVRRGLFWLGAVIGVVGPLTVWFSGLSRTLRIGLSDWPVWAGLPAYVALVTFILMLLSAPLSYYRGFVIRHRYGLSTQTVGGWLADWLKSTLLGVLLATAGGTLFYVTLLLVPDIWWLVFWAEAMLAVVLVTFVAPYVIVPIFFKPRPVDDPGIVMMIEELVRRAKTTVAGISRLDFSRRTNEANAAVIGFGRSRRVVLADTLLKTFPALEIRAVVAHELGHHVHRDVLWLLVTQGVMMLVGVGLGAAAGDPILQAFGAAGLADPSAYPLLVAGASLFGLLTMPVVNAISRAIEARADTYAFRLLGDGRPFAAAMRRLADQNLAEERPPRWAELLLYTHPPIYRRVERAEAAHHA
jgi:STE24 endopeptidase